MLAAISLAQPTMPTGNKNHLVLEEKSLPDANDEIATASEVILRTPRSIDNYIAPGKIYRIQRMCIVCYDKQKALVH